jgi:hypothetical protein
MCRFFSIVLFYACWRGFFVIMKLLFLVFIKYLVFFHFVIGVAVLGLVIGEFEMKDVVLYKFLIQILV